MKKTIAKSSSAKTPAPATKAVSSVKAAVKPAAKPVVKKPAAKKPVVAAKAAVVAKVPAVKVTKAKPAAVTTTIVAAVDVGFGNTLTLRGAGPGLSWDSGVTLECVADDRWSITLPESSEPIICKFLLNDETWSVGADYTVLPGSSVVFSPVF